MKKNNITILEIYYILIIIFNLLNYENYEIRFNNEVLAYSLVILINCIIIYISLNKINEKNLGRILILGLVLYIVNTFKNIDIVFKFILLVSNIIIYYLKRDTSKTIKITALVIIMSFLSVLCFIIMAYTISIYDCSEFSFDEKYEVCVKDISGGAWPSFMFSVNLYENKINLGIIRIVKKYQKTIRPHAQKLTVKWNDNNSFSLYSSKAIEGGYNYDTYNSNDYVIDGYEIYEMEFMCKYTIEDFIDLDV